MFIVYLQVFHPKTVPGRLCVSVWPRSMCLHSAQEGRPLRTVSNLCCSREMMESEFIFFFCCCWTVQQMFSLTGFSMKCLFKCTTKSCWKIKYCYKWNFKCTNKQIIHFFIIFALLTYFWQNNHDYEGCLGLGLRCRYFDRKLCFTNLRCVVWKIWAFKRQNLVVLGLDPHYLFFKSV